MRVNVGCGQTPTAGWRNFDNSPTLRLAKIPFMTELLGAVGLLSEPQRQFAAFAKAGAVEYADAVRHIPLPSGSVDVVYSSHMLEHLHPQAARAFLGEVRRVLHKGGWIRIAVPDLEFLVEQYRTDGDADALIRRTLLATPATQGALQRLQALLVGSRHHLWMYDGRSLGKLLQDCGFVEVQKVAAGTTRITDPGALDLAERSDESVYVEARNP